MVYAMPIGVEYFTRPLKKIVYKYLPENMNCMLIGRLYEPAVAFPLQLKSRQQELRCVEALKTLI